MWDCKTSKMSQSPRAALNAFGLFAAGPIGLMLRCALCDTRCYVAWGVAERGPLFRLCSIVGSFRRQLLEFAHVSHEPWSALVHLARVHPSPLELHVRAAVENEVVSISSSSRPRPS